MSAEADLEDAADALDVDPGEMQAIFEDVERVLRDLAEIDVDINDPADLDRVRSMLPTEPHRARLIKAALPPALDNAIEYANPDERESYWRRAPERRDLSALSDAEIVQRYEFAQAAKRTRGVRGTVETADGREVSAAPMQIGEQLEGQEFDPEPAETEGDRGKGLDILQRIRDVL